MTAEKRLFLIDARQKLLDEIIVHPLYHKFVEYIDEYDRNLDHYLRYCMTFAEMLKSVDILQTAVIRETGRPCPITRFYAHLGYDACDSGGDLRYAIEEPGNSVDFMLSFEVMEHVKDQREKTFSDIEIFNETGVRAFAAEIARVLRPGGALILTTPNPHSALVLERWANFEPPMLYRPHVREYTIDEIQQIFSNLKLEKYITLDPFFGFNREPGRMEAQLAANGWSAENRGEMHFCVFRKPA
jgi:SAM-dependent methyltransferase